MFVEEYTHYDQIPPAYVQACMEHNQNLFFDPQWFALLEKHIVQNGTAVKYLCFLDERKKIEAILPLLITKTHPRNLNSFANFYSLDFSPLFTKPIHQSGKTIKKIAEYFCQHAAHWDSLHLFPVDADSLAIIQLEHAFREKGFETVFDFFHHNWIYINPGLEFAQFLARGARNDQLASMVVANVLNDEGIKEAEEKATERKQKVAAAKALEEREQKKGDMIKGKDCTLHLDPSHDPREHERIPQGGGWARVPPTPTPLQYVF